MIKKKSVIIPAIKYGFAKCSTYWREAVVLSLMILCLGVPFFLVSKIVPEAFGLQYIFWGFFWGWLHLGYTRLALQIFDSGKSSILTAFSPPIHEILKASIPITGITTFCVLITFLQNYMHEIFIVALAPFAFMTCVFSMTHLCFYTFFIAEGKVHPYVNTNFLLS